MSVLSQVWLELKSWWAGLMDKWQREAIEQEKRKMNFANLNTQHSTLNSQQQRNLGKTDSKTPLAKIKHIILAVN